MLHHSSRIFYRPPADAADLFFVDKIRFGKNQRRGKRGERGKDEEEEDEREDEDEDEDED